MIYAAIAAGGVGSRMGADMPKQFLELSGEPVIIHTVKAFRENVDRVYIGVVSDWVKYTEELLEKFGLEDFATVVNGGANRMETLYNIICKIESETPSGEEDILLTHDAVRPFINNRIINENIEKCRQFGACGTYVPAVDTIAVSEDGLLLSSVPKRSTMFNTQTPQTAKLKLLKSVFEENISRFEEFTDLCGMLNAIGVKVALAEGEYTNIKITTPSDLITARGILGE